ncbi:hypothetical protein FDP41_013215 [Naegleria fowleri]|uniref:Uncharacterized protein n=1 Tax=Naegleria fowleri TaxID=5763 RepID=A0A6A5C1U3_NAEFO|nr:uncharacterized protein FDP41_013215 [Naegleria fowleri]KAF0980732.1 hypothetical protein FDP41_013215 [Naegleria fowleri]
MSNNYHQVVLVMNCCGTTKPGNKPSSNSSLLYFRDIVINIHQAIKEWALKTILFLKAGQRSLSLTQEKLLLSIYSTSNHSSLQMVLAQDDLSLPLLNTSLKNHQSQYKDCHEDNVISSQIVYFTTEKFDCVSEDLNQTLGELYGDNIDLHVIKVVHDFETDVCLDTAFIDMIETFPNTRSTSVFNDPLCISRELFLSTKHILKRQGREMALLISSNIEALKFSVLPSSTLNDFEISVSDRKCQCHHEKVNSNVFYKQLQKGFVCSSTLKIIDHSDTVPLLRIGDGLTELLFNSGIDEKNQVVHTIIEMQAVSRVKLCSLPYELLIGETCLLIPSIDMDISKVEQNESEVYYLCRHLVDNNEGLLCRSESSFKATSIKDSGLIYHFLVVPDLEMKCLIIRQIATSDEVVPPVFLSRLTQNLPNSKVLKELENIEVTDEFNPLSVNSNKINFVYKTIALASAHQKKNDEKKPKWDSRTSLMQSSTSVNEPTSRRAVNIDKGQSKRVKKLVFK